MYRDTEGELIRGLFAIGASIGAGYVARHLFNAAGWLGGGLWKDSIQLSVIMALVSLGLFLRGAYLVGGAVRHDFRESRRAR